MMRRKETSLLVESWRSFINEGEVEIIEKQSPEAIFNSIKDEVGIEPGLLKNYSCYSAKPDYAPLNDLEDLQYAYNNDGQDRGLYLKSGGKLCTIPFIKADTAYFKSGSDAKRSDAPIVKFENALKNLGFTQRDGFFQMQ